MKTACSIGVALFFAARLAPVYAACDPAAECKTPQLARVCNVAPPYDSIFAEEVIPGATARSIYVNGIPDHDIGIFPMTDDICGCGRPNAISPHLEHVTLPFAPTGAAPPKTDLVLPNPFGLAVNGVLLDPLANEWWYTDPTDPSKNTWQKNALLHPDMATDLDCNMGHIQPDGGYHYHGLPTGLYESRGGTYPWTLPSPTPDTHIGPGSSFTIPVMAKMVLLGWAFDGVPIYGPTCYKSTATSNPQVYLLAPNWWKPRSSWILKGSSTPANPADDVRPATGPPGNYNGDYVDDFVYSPGAGDLDECNGHTAPTIDAPNGNGVYHYHITEEYPYIPHCFHYHPDYKIEAVTRLGFKDSPFTSPSKRKPFAAPTTPPPKPR
jgi:hypothetical protein